MTKTITIGELFTEHELKRAMARKNDHKFLKEEIVEPVIARINRVTGQDNDPTYWAYALEYALNQFPEIR